MPRAGSPVDTPLVVPLIVTTNWTALIKKK
jgi:hypothetical protein